MSSDILLVALIVFYWFVAVVNIFAVGYDFWCYFNKKNNSEFSDLSLLIPRVISHSFFIWLNLSIAIGNTFR